MAGFEVDQVQVIRREKPVLEFTGCSGSDIPKAVEFPADSLATSFGNPGSNRSRASSHLTGQTRHLLLRRAASRLVRPQSHSMRLLPCLKMPGSMGAEDPAQPPVILSFLTA